MTAVRLEAVQAPPRKKRLRHLVAPPPRPTRLPEAYGDTTIALLAVDPRRLHVAWEVSSADLAEAARDLGEPGRPVLRFHDVTLIDFDGTNANSTFDVEIDASARSWYVEVWSSGRSYVVDLVRVAAGGRCALLARSNAVQMHRGGEGPAGPVEWMLVEGDPRRRRRALDPASPEAIMASVRREDVVAFYRDLVETANER